MEDLGYLLDQLFYVINNNAPKAIILGHIELSKLDGGTISSDEINSYCKNKIHALNIPVYYIDHFKNIIRFSTN